MTGRVCSFCSVFLCRRSVVTYRCVWGSNLCGSPTSGSTVQHSTALHQSKSLWSRPAVAEMDHHNAVRRSTNCNEQKRIKTKQRLTQMASIRCGATIRCAYMDSGDLGDEQRYYAESERTTTSSVILPRILFPTRIVTVQWPVLNDWLLVWSRAPITWHPP